MSEVALPVVPEVKLNLVDLPVSKMHPNPWNPNRQRDVVAKAQRESLAAFGFIDPVTVRPHPEIAGEWEIVDGEHRYHDAVALGLETVPSLSLDLDDAAARKLTVVLNETRGDADVALLAKLLTDLSKLQDVDQLSVALPYSSAELDHLLSLGNEDWGDFGEYPTPAPPTADAVEHEIVLSFTEARHDEFRTLLTILEKEYGVGNAVSDVVFEAVRRAALDVHQS